jgi:predicted secreted protein
MRGLTMQADIERYIHEQNLILYRKVLSETTDQTKRQTVLSLLEDEQANPARRSRQDG